MKEGLIRELQIHLTWFAENNPTPTPFLTKGRGDFASALLTCGSINEAQKDCAERFAAFIPQLKTRQLHINEVHKFATRAVELAEKKLDARKQQTWEAKEIKKQRDALDTARDNAISAIKSTLYVKAQVTWLQTRFPEAVFVNDFEKDKVFRTNRDTRCLKVLLNRSM